MHYTSLLDSQSVAADMWSSQLLTGRPVAARKARCLRGTVAYLRSASAELS